MLSMLRTVWRQAQAHLALERIALGLTRSTPACWMPLCKNLCVRHSSGALRTFYIRGTDPAEGDWGLAHACPLHQPAAINPYGVGLAQQVVAGMYWLKAMTRLRRAMSNYPVTFAHARTRVLAVQGYDPNTLNQET